MTLFGYTLILASDLEAYKNSNAYLANKLATSEHRVRAFENTTPVWGNTIETIVNNTKVGMRKEDRETLLNIAKMMREVDPKNRQA